MIMAKKFVLKQRRALDPYSSNYTELFAFYQLKAPTINSFQKGDLPERKYGTVLYKMLKGWESYEFINPQSRMCKRLNKYNMLNSQSIKCAKMRFIAKRKNTKENDFCCLLRHLRNSIAHGRVFLEKVGGSEYLLFDDTMGDKCSARIIITMRELEKWKSIIEKNMKKDN